MLKIQCLLQLQLSKDSLKIITLQISRKFKDWLRSAGWIESLRPNATSLATTLVYRVKMLSRFIFFKFNIEECLQRRLFRRRCHSVAV